MSAALRVATPADADDVRAIYAPIVTDTAISFEARVPSAESMSERIATTLATHPWLVCSEGERVLGYAYATRHRARAAYRWSVETSVYVCEGARGRGMAAGLYSSLVAVLGHQHFRRAYAGITLPNAASVSLHEISGFTPVGVFRKVGCKFGAWHDVGWWERDLGEGPSPPSEPVPFAEVAGDPALARALAAGAERVRDAR